MADSARQLHLNLFIHGRGHHEAAWRHPAASPLPLTDIRYYTDLARKAEAGCSIPSSWPTPWRWATMWPVRRAPGWNPSPRSPPSPASPRRIGLIATCSTTYTEPFNLARQFASLDHITGGRVGWNIVTTWLATASGNYGGQGPFSHADRYERAEDYMRVVTGLWDSWSDDAVLDDRPSGTVCARRRHSARAPRRRALPCGRAAEPAAWSARPSGLRPGRLVRNRPPLCRATCRGGVHCADGEGDGEGLLCGPEDGGGLGGRAPGRC